jgi:hypothetical protein
MARDVTPKAAAGLATARTDTAIFRDAFTKNPAATLKEKGIVLSEKEAATLADKVKALQVGPGRGGEAASVEVGVTVKI